MVAKTFDMSQPTTTTERIEPRSDMFSQSSALYSRINKRKSTSPWMIIAPVAVVVLVGGALLASTGSHQAVLVKAKPAPTSSKTSMSATTASAPVANAGAPIAQPVKAAAPAKAEARNIVAKRAESTRISTNSTPTFAPRPASNGATSAPSAYDGAKAAVPVATAQAAPVAPAQTVTATPDTVTPAPVPTHATPAPTPDTSATPPAPAGQTAPQLTTTPPQA